MQKIAPSVLAALAVLGACSSDSDETSAPTSQVAVESQESANTEPGATETTAEPTTTTEEPAQPTEGVTGIVWESVVSDNRVNVNEPAPTYEAAGITSRVQLVLYIEAGTQNDEQRECADEARFRQDYEGGALATHCILIQYAFNVPADFPTGEFSPDGGLSSDALVTPDGHQINSALISSGYPGTIDNGLTAIYADGVPGSTIRFNTGSNLVGWTTHVFEVPPIEAFQPVYFD